MALSGYFYGTTANSRIKPKLTWEAVQNVAENYSDITVTLSYSRTNSGYTTAGNWSGTIYLGDQSQSGKKYITVTYNSDTPALTATFRVYHDEYGQLKVKLWAEGEIYNPSDSSLKDTAISGEIEPDTIPRACAVSATDGAIGSRVTVVVERKNEAFTHSLQYRFGALTGWIDGSGAAGESETRYTGEVINFLLPESFYAQIPDRQSDLCTLTCRTYLEDTLIGGQETEFTVTTDPSLCAPTLQVTAKNIDPATLAITGREDLYVRYLSVAECTVAAVGQKGATVTQVTCQGQEVAGDTHVIAPVETENLVFTVTDSRGYTASVTLQLELLPYVLLTSNATVNRTDPTSGEAVLTLQGSCWKGDFPLLSNALTAAWTVGGETFTAEIPLEDDHTYRYEVRLTGLDYRQSHPVFLAVSDAVMTAQQDLTVHKGLPVFHWGETDFQFHVPVDVPELTVSGIPLAEYIRSIVNEI